MKAITQTTVNQWSAHLSVGGLRRWWTLGSLTRHRDQPAAAHLLAQCLQKSAPLSMSQRAEKALRRTSSQPAKDAVIDCWLEGKAGETVRQIIEERGWRHSDEARWFKFLSQRNRFDEYFVTQLAPLIDQYETVARMAARLEREEASQALFVAAAAALGQISAPEAVDSLIDCWLEARAGETVREVVDAWGWLRYTEAPWLEFSNKRNERPAKTVQKVIEDMGWRHSDEAQWLKFLTQRNRFDEYFVAQLAPLIDQPAVARMLAHPEDDQASEVAAGAAAAALSQISAPESIDAVIDCWLEDKAGETARQVIEQRRWRHSEEARWLLYLAATGRFDEYLAEDYEFQTLRPEFLAAPASLKACIREAVVKAGEVRMNGLFLAEKRAAELTVADAEALVHINIRNQNWEALAGNLWWLPARQILDAVQAIIAAKWKPHDADQAALLARLVEITPLLAVGTPERPDALPLNPVYQKWLSSGETGPLFSKLPVKLKAMIEDEVDPPDQIAALGALRKQGQLDVATVAKAGLSEHWMVRWVAVHFGADLTQAMRVNDAGIEWFRRLTILRTDGDAEALWTAKPCEVTRDGLEALREHIARLPNPRAAGGLLLVEAICTHYTSHDIEVEEGARVTVEEDSFEVEG